VTEYMYRVVSAGGHVPTNGSFRAKVYTTSGAATREVTRMNKQSKAWRQGRKYHVQRAEVVWEDVAE
jgi:hypothetical protein